MPPRGERLCESLADLIFQRLRGVQPVTVGRFEEQGVAVGQGFRVGVHRRVVAAKVATEHEVMPADRLPHLDERGAQDMAGFVIAHRQSCDVEVAQGLVDRLEPAQRLLSASCAS